MTADHEHPPDVAGHRHMLTKLDRLGSVCDMGQMTADHEHPPDVADGRMLTKLDRLGSVSVTRNI